MHLSNIAAKHINEPLEAWDEVTKTFVPGAFLGRIDPSDRSASSSNKPLRRRLMFTEVGTQLPASRTFRHPGTQEVYLVGQTRGDALGGEHYLNMSVCHLVTDVMNMGSGLARITRKIPNGPAEDPGWLVDSLLGETFVDTEFSTSSNEPGMHETKVETYQCFTALHWQLKPWDFIELHGAHYRVVDTFADSGLFGTRIDLESDTRINFVLQVTGDQVYDRINHRYVTDKQSYNVTGVLTNFNDFSSWASESESYFDVSIEAEHIGFRPEPNDTTLEFEGVTRTVTHVSTQSGERQYTLRCR